MDLGGTLIKKGHDLWMMDKNVLGPVKLQIVAEIDEAKRRLGEDCAQLRAKQHSSIVITAMISLCCDSMKTLAESIWTILREAVVKCHIKCDPKLGQEMKHFVSSQLPKGESFGGGLIRDTTIPFMSGMLAQLKKQSANRINIARNNALRKIHGKIDLLVIEMNRAQEDSGAEEKSTIINVHSPVGAIQTGDSSVANVSQNIDTETRRSLLSALSRLEEKVQSIAELPSHSKSEIIDIVKEVQGELKSKKPNQKKVRAFLRVIPLAVKGAGALKPAYDAIKTIIVDIGSRLS